MEEVVSEVSQNHKEDPLLNMEETPLTDQTIQALKELVVDSVVIGLSDEADVEAAIEETTTE